MTADVELADETLADRAYRVLRDRLVLLDISPGEPLSESVLADEIGVGRTPMREALKRLEADYLVVTYPRRGTFASAVDLTDLAEITEIRGALVPLAARRAAAVRGGEAAAALTAVLEEVRAVTGEESRRDLMELDLAVHRIVDHAASSSYLEETLVRLDGLGTRLWCLLIDRLPAMRDHVCEHVPLMEAILAGDEQEAEALARAHVHHFDTAVRAVL
ncbi:GntR family transcriptional regulator [Brevibacterium jeotgali]|uniref:DNA-binding transcriptional regulator, GntR family n=1 Tax=Brevibacterium jeotgali TaxID=1262550 RepID=A0A2H1L1F6_9MICO|nr:GntR family transcriptional regulator [Brevibacterium jeotgali]TWC01908.1 GntR family transcriptional regulator [Brevibacterium jeotgali]SMY10741.1 DNA-binding transcriptional regulator, GntR family [Brevibacterium jeotgali]